MSLLQHRNTTYNEVIMQVTQTNSTQSTPRLHREFTTNHCLSSAAWSRYEVPSTFWTKIKVLHTVSEHDNVCCFFLRKSEHQNKLKDNKGVVKEGKLKCLLLMVYVIIHHDQTCSIVWDWLCCSGLSEFLSYAKDLPVWHYLPRSIHDSTPLKKPG